MEILKKWWRYIVNKKVILGVVLLMFLLSIIAIADNGDDVVETDISEGVDG